MPQPVLLKKLKLSASKRTRSPRTITQRNVLFIIWNCNVKVGSKEIPGVTGKFCLEVQNEAGQKLAVLPKKKH